MSSSSAPSAAGADIPFISWKSDGTNEAAPRIAVLAAHGRGQSPAFMREQAMRLAVPGLKFYAPHAPNDTWYPLGFMEPLIANEPKLSESLNSLASLLRTIEADGFTAEQIVLWGFSQGACLITQFALEHPAPYAGLLIFTGGYVGPHTLSPVVHSKLTGVPVVIRSIDEDPWVPKKRVEETAELFARAGAIVNLRIDRGNVHGITDEAIYSGGSLLKLLSVHRPDESSDPN